MNIQDTQQTAERKNPISFGTIYFNAVWGKKYYDSGLEVQYRLAGNTRWITPDADFDWPEVVRGREVRYWVGSKL